MRWNRAATVDASVRTARVLASPGTPFQQDVPIGQQADQEAFDHVALPDDHLADFRDEPVDEDALLVDAVVDDP